MRYPTCRPSSRTRRPSLVLAGVLALALPSLRAADPQWTLEAGPAWWFNAKVSFGARAAADPAATAGTDRTYDDGYNRRDATGNLGDGAGGPLASRTGYFGYSAASQVNLTAGTLTMHQLQADGAYLPGRRLGAGVGPHVALRFHPGSEGSGSMDLAWELSFDAVSLDQHDSGALPASLRLLSDAYPLGGVVPQAAPYSGRFTPSPGDQRIGDTPVRSISQVSGTADGSRALDLDLQLLRFGPVVRFAGGPEQGWSASVQAGLAYLHAKAALTVDETLRASSLPGAPRTLARASDTWGRLGWFAGLRVRRPLNAAWAVGLRADWVAVGEHTLADATRSAKIDTSSPLVGALTLDYRW